MSSAVVAHYLSPSSHALLQFSSPPPLGIRFLPPAVCLSVRRPLPLAADSCATYASARPAALAASAFVLAAVQMAHTSNRCPTGASVRAARVRTSLYWQAPSQASHLAAAARAVYGLRHPSNTDSRTGSSAGTSQRMRLLSSTANVHAAAVCAAVLALPSLLTGASTALLLTDACGTPS